MNCEWIVPCIWNIVCLVDVETPGPKFSPIPRTDFMGCNWWSLRGPHA